MLVGFNSVHGVLVLDVGETFADVGFAVDGEMDLRVSGVLVMCRM